MTPERRRQSGRASADYQIWLRSIGYKHRPRGPLSEQTKENMRRAKTPEQRAKASRRMRDIHARRKQVKARGVVAVVGWDGRITQLK